VIRHSIFAKIFLWFWIALVLVSASVVFVTLLTGAQPLAQRWLASSLDLYAATAVDFYDHGGKPRLQDFLDEMERTAGIHATLIDPQGHDILGRGIPQGAERVYERARASGESRFFTRFIWTGAAITHAPQGDFYLVARVYPLRGAFPRPSFRAAFLKFVAAIIAAGLLSLLLALHFANPIRTLQSAAGRIADGDFSARTQPFLPRRDDEIGELSQDFDRMAACIESLLRKQHELLGEISHELRSPLTRMNVSLELARRGETDSLERMQSELDRLESLIAQILTLTRLDALDGHKPLTTVNLTQLLESVVDDANFEGKSEGKSVHLVAAAECLVSGDPSLLRSCLENVVRNAIRYTPPGTQVETQLSLPANGSRTLAEIVIRDQGPGVSPEALPRLFEPFYRVSEARERGTGGNGLGLAIAQRTAQFHSGTIQARNLIPSGLEVKITLPTKNATLKSL